MKTEIIDGHRIYVTATGERYPGVTSVLSQTKPPEAEEGLKKWRAKVGEDVAEYIINRSATTGTKTHLLIEEYLTGQRLKKPIKDLLPRAHFANMEDPLSRITDATLEMELVSDLLKIAGRADCIGYYNGKYSVIDFKTARRPKRREWITDYFLQATAYCEMYEETTNTEQPKNIVIIVSSEDGKLQIFEEDPHRWKNRLYERIGQYYANR